MKKRVTSAVAAASVAGGVVIGSFLAPPMTAFAADGSTSATAQATARTPGQWITDSLKGLVDKGTITQEQSDAVAETLKEARPKVGFGHGGGGFGHLDTAKAAEVLGLSQADLRTQMQSKSIADIAKEKNVDIQKVIDALVASAKERLDASVSSGKLTQEEADQKQAEITRRITEFVNLTRPEPPTRPGDALDGGLSTPPTPALPAEGEAA
jgi:polyhydroxyalkanoate synthesis regulator phasin